MAQLLKKNIAWVIVIVLLIIAIYQYLNKPEPIIDERIEKYEQVITELEKKITKTLEKVDSLSENRDSLFVELSKKAENDKEKINEKYQKQNNALLVLSDDESVGVLAENIRGK